MADGARTTRVRVDSDGVRTIVPPGVRRSVWLLAAAVGLVALVVLMIVRPLLRVGGNDRGPASASLGGSNVRPNSPQQHAPIGTSEPPAARAEAARVVLPETHPHGLAPHAAAADAATDTAAAELANPEETGTDVAARADSTDGPTGIALFPPPGTDPIKSGIIVPDDFPLPPGYVRHYQVTDDGHPLPAILMFHPDYHPVDEHGQPIAIPDNRIVPREMAPPGMPIQMLEVPKGEPGTTDAPPDGSADSAAP